VKISHCSTALLACLATLCLACGSAESPTSPEMPGISPPVAPFPGRIEGPYTLSITPDPTCGFPVALHTIPVDAATVGTAAQPELRATLPGGDTTLTVEMLYEGTGRVRGAIGTIEAVLFQSGFWIFVRGVGDAVISAAADGRGEIVDAPMTGEVEVLNDTASFGSCSSLDHAFSLRPR